MHPAKKSLGTFLFYRCIAGLYQIFPNLFDVNANTLLLRPCHTSMRCYKNHQNFRNESTRVPFSGKLNTHSLLFFCFLWIAIWLHSFVSCFYLIFCVIFFVLIFVSTYYFLFVILYYFLHLLLSFVIAVFLFRSQSFWHR